MKKYSKLTGGLPRSRERGNNTMLHHHHNGSHINHAGVFRFLKPGDTPPAPLTPPPVPTHMPPPPPPKPEMATWKHFVLTMLVAGIFTSFSMYCLYIVLTGWPQWTFTAGGYLDRFATWVLP